MDVRASLRRISVRCGAGDQAGLILNVAIADHVSRQCRFNSRPDFETHALGWNLSQESTAMSRRRREATFTPAIFLIMIRQLRGSHSLQVYLYKSIE